ncbi:MAG: hypothetical protein ACJ75J_05120 [Cytophagaceae bacterium]
MIKNIKKKTLSIGLLLSMVLFMSVKCKHNETFIGPEYRLASSGFQSGSFMVIAPDPTNVIFASPNKDTVRFNATFNDRVTWFVDLKGLTSGAKKRITGLSQNLQSYPTAYWTGTSDDMIMFASGENVEATLSFMGSSVSYKDTVHITTKRDYSNIVKLVNDFETTTDGTFPAGGPPYWYTYNAQPADVIWDGASSNKSTLSSDPRIPNGNKYFLFHGTDKLKGFFILGAGFDKQLQVPAGYGNPDSLYFNIYVYGFGLSNTKFQVGFDEDDQAQNGTYDPLTEDEWDYITKVDWVGWRLLSFKYSETIRGVAPNGGNGNGIREPLRIQKMGFGMNSDPNGGTAKVAFDYPIFTYGAPFDPNK